MNYLPRPDSVAYDRTPSAICTGRSRPRTCLQANRSHPVHPQRLARTAACLTLTCASLLPACLEPEVSDYPTYSHRIMPAASSVPGPDERTMVRLKGADGFEDAPLATRQGYFGGKTVSFWDFGEANPAPQEAWVFRKLDTSGSPVDFGHPALVDQIPGDEGYSPLCDLQLVYVTKRYAEEQITSFAALEDALELGLVQEPIPMGQVVQWPIAREGAELQLPDGSQVPTTPVYYRGHQVQAFMLEDVLPSLHDVEVSRRGVSPADVYAIRPRNSASALRDNHVFTQDPNSPGYTGFWTMTTVMVDADYMPGSLNDATAVFSTDEDGERLPSDSVISFESEPSVRFWPLIPEL